MLVIDLVGCRFDPPIDATSGQSEATRSGEGWLPSTISPLMPQAFNSAPVGRARPVSSGTTQEQTPPGLNKVWQGQ